MRSVFSLKVIGSVALLCLSQVAAWNNGLGLVPPMGWTNSFAYGKNLSDDTVISTAQFLIDSGLRDLGYKYISLADGWQNDARESNGTLLPNPTRFPKGLADLSMRLNKMGFGLGVSSSPGTKTCIT